MIDGEQDSRGRAPTVDAAETVTFEDLKSKALRQGLAFCHAWLPVFLPQLGGEKRNRDRAASGGVRGASGRGAGSSWPGIPRCFRYWSEPCHAVLQCRFP